MVNSMTQLDEVKDWLVIRSTGTGPNDGECVIHNGTLEDVKAFTNDTSYGQSAQDALQGLWSIFIPMDIVYKAINRKTLSLEDIGLGR